MIRNMRKRNVIQESGFSLVEVTLALAIAAVAMLSIMGMIPTGLAALREAADSSIGGRIHQQLMNQIRLSDFDQIGRSFNGQIFYFDEFGEEVKSGSDRITAYAARVQINEVVGLDESADEKFDPNAYSVLIDVAATTSASFQWDSPRTRHLRNRHQARIVRTGKVDG